MSPSRRLLAAAVVLGVAAAVLLLLLPLGSQSEIARTPGGTSETRVEQVSLLDNEGAGVLVVLLLPAVVAALPLLAPARARRPATTAAAVVLAVFTLLSLASIGLFLLPVTALVVAAAVVERRGTSGPEPTA